MPTLSLLLPLGAYGALTAVGVDGGKAGTNTSPLCSWDSVPQWRRGIPFFLHDIFAVSVGHACC